MSHRKLDWRGVGQFRASMVQLETAIVAMFKEAKVSVEIIEWLIGEGLDDLKRVCASLAASYRNSWAYHGLKPVKVVHVEIPQNFTLGSCVTPSLWDWDRNITDGNFPQSPLEPGKRYSAQICELVYEMGPQSLVNAGLEKKYILGGAHGIALLRKHYADSLIISHGIIGIESREKLFKNPASPGWILPIVFWASGGGWRLELHNWDRNLSAGTYVVFFREMT